MNFKVQQSYSGFLAITFTEITSKNYTNLERLTSEEGTRVTTIRDWKSASGWKQRDEVTNGKWNKKQTMHSDTWATFIFLGIKIIITTQSRKERHINKRLKTYPLQNQNWQTKLWFRRIRNKMAFFCQVAAEKKNPKKERKERECQNKSKGIGNWPWILFAVKQCEEQKLNKSGSG